jgi:hypothetical protein
LRKYSPGITPTSHCWEPYSRIEDYEMKVSITMRLTSAKY